MPLKDPEKRKQYQAEYGRKWYQAHREEVIRRVAERKHTVYGGTCKNCGGPTIGQSKGQAAEYCARLECRSAQMRAEPERHREAHRRGVKYTKEMRRWSQRKKTASLDEILAELEEKPKRRS